MTINRNIGVQQLDVASLRPNPYNPRRLFDREPLKTLEASIKKVGILVPLTVYWDDEIAKHVILDGQRRWLCARSLSLATVPANVVAKPTLVQNIVTMFQIHKLREDWELMPTALTLKLLMDELAETRVRQLADLTGLDQATVVRCKKLLSFPLKFQDLMLDSDPKSRVKADFFIELFAVTNDREVKKMEWFRRNHFAGRMLERYREGRLASVTDFRLMKQYINNAAKAKKTAQISKRLREFAENSALPISHLDVADSGVATTVRAMIRSIASLEVALNSIDIDRIYGQEDLWKRLVNLVSLIRQRLADADRKPQ